MTDAQYLGFDLSTTALSVGVRGTEGTEDFAAVSMRGSIRWHDQPAFLLEYLPLMLTSALWQLEDRGWSFNQPGNLSFSVRQHDMTLLEETLEPMIPALSWECHVAQREVRILEELGVHEVVGPIAPRFILPKLMWALATDPELESKVHQVATTGDYIAARLTGQLRLSTSDALSNALLDQQTKQLARDAMRNTTVSADWFPPVIASGKPVGRTTVPSGPDANGWRTVQNLLDGWSVAAGLGDNHASAVGCGLADPGTIVVSGGSSGTVVRMCRPTASLRGEANCFEFYDDRLLLMMLPDCAIWYNRFIEQVLNRPVDHNSFNQAALEADVAKLRRVRQEHHAGGVREVYPDQWQQLPWAERVASTQLSIALELLLLVQQMLVEVQNAKEPVRRFVLTGGLCQAPLIRSVLFTGLRELVPEALVKVSDRTDKLAFQSATYGALINAILLGDYARLPATIQRLCPLRDCEVPEPQVRSALLDQLRRYLVT